MKGTKHRRNFLKLCLFAWILSYAHFNIIFYIYLITYIVLSPDDIVFSADDLVLSVYSKVFSADNNVMSGN
jgi:uncharacterized membrane protein